MTLPDHLCRLVGRLGSGAIVTVCVLAALALCGCSPNEGVESYFVDPARFTLYHCKDFPPRLAELLAQQKSLRDLMDKASQGGGGTVIGGLSYRAQYEKAVGEERLLRRTAAEKKCELPASDWPTPVGASNPPAPLAPAAHQSDQSIR